MNKTFSKFLPDIAAGFLIALALFFPNPSYSVHAGAGNIVCGSCHTMHASQGGAGMDGTEQAAQ